jgi:holo-[acyl-carrier protein] synthase
MSAPGVGLDLLEIDRLRAALDRRPTLAVRLFTEAERAYAASRARPAQHLAVRFCAKEAVAKALALEVWSWQDIEVVGDGGPPRIVLHGALAGRPEAIDVSLTHSRGMAAAVAVVRR